jgi:hypothetical protein
MSAADVRHGLFCYGVPTLQCLVACVQRYLVLYHDLDIWKGVGFGMFSAISAQSLHQMTVTLVLPDGRERRFRWSASSSVSVAGPPAFFGLYGDLVFSRARIESGGVVLFSLCKERKVYHETIAFRDWRGTDRSRALA